MKRITESLTKQIEWIQKRFKDSNLNIPSFNVDISKIKEKLNTELFTMPVKVAKNRLKNGNEKILSIGIDIGNNSMKIATIAPKGEEHHSQLEMISLQDDDEIKPGNGLNTDRIIEIVNKRMVQLPLNVVSVRVCLSATINNIFVIDIPGDEELKLNENIPWELTPFLPGLVEDYEYSYKVLDIDPAGEKTTVIVAVYQKNTVRQLLQAFKKADTVINVLDTDSLPMLDLFKKDTSDEDSSYGLLQLGAAHCNYLVVTPDSHPQYLYIPFGGNTLNEIIARINGLTTIEAEELRRSSDSDTAMQQINANVMLKKEIDLVLQKLADTIIRYNIYNQRKTGNKIEKLYVTGGLVNDSIITDFINRSTEILKIPCETWDPVQKYFKKDMMQANFSFHFSSALGLALR